MALIKRTVADSWTYRRLIYLLSAVPLGPLWFAALVTLWALSFGLAITPLGILVWIVLGFATRGAAAVEAELARSLLRADAHAPALPPSGRGFWAWLRAMFGAGFWRAQAWLLIRSVAGFAVGVTVLSLLASALGLVFAPIWVPFKPGGAQLGLWRPHTFVQSLALVPVGLVLLPVGLLIVAPLAAAFRSIAARLLGDEQTAASARAVDTTPTIAARRTATVPPRRAFELHAGLDGVLILGLIVIWALTSGGYFWPIWVALPLGGALAIHAWFVLVGERPSLVDHFRGSRTLALTAGAGVVIGAYFIVLWVITGGGYFWPVWPILAISIVVGVLAVAVGSSPRHAEMAERIETLESSRAGAVDAQDSELRRIERDLHDGAQARLVALGMSLGMAEQKLAEDPEQVGALLAEARAGAEHALRELRDLARGIHPPVLGDRGLEAAVRSLASSTPMPVKLSVDVAQRPAPAVESAAYFFVAEALANAAKHAHAGRVEIRITRVGDALELDVSDDGVGGADAAGTGLRGLKRRLEALDGTLTVSSPPGGPTRISAVLPCG